MDVIIKDGDPVQAGSGELLKAQGVQALFQRGEILMNMHRERFYLRPEMGTCLSEEDFGEPEKVELLLNEALTPVEGLTARVTEINGLTAKVRLMYGDLTKECEVTFNEYI